MKNILATLFMLALSPAFGQLKYPVTKKVDTFTNYHGTMVADPYRWLEDDFSAQTKDWVTEQNKVTFAYLDQIPFRAAWRNRLEELSDYKKFFSPFRKKDYIYYYRNDGLQNQNILYRQKGLNGKEELVLDPNKFSADGTTVLATFSLSKDGKYAVVGKSKGGSDWRNLYVMDMQTLTFLPDSILWVKNSGASWQGDGFFYSRYPETEKGKELSTRNEYQQVYYHKLGDPQSADILVYKDDVNAQRFHGVYTDEDERFVFLNISDRGKGKDGNALWYFDNESGEKIFKPIIEEPGDFDYGIVDVVDGKFLVSTNDGAPNRKVVLVDPQSPAPSNWKTIIAEKPENLTSVSSAGGRLFTSYMKDVTSRVYVYDLSGKLLNDVTLPGLGTASGFGGLKDDKEVFYSFTSINFPPTYYRYDIATGKSTFFRANDIQFNPEDFTVEQVFYPSKDGTKIPMFIAYKKGLKKNGKNPTILYGYGGFNISSTPAFSVLRIGWLEQGGIFCIANLRGGSEYGEKWHEAGMKLKKQNVFDDFISAGEFLIKNNYTAKDYLAIQGGSNGGLLVGAVMNQRPDLFKVAIPQVGVMDMLRFQKFTIGWNWTADYGNSDNAEDFRNLYAYSPMHNIKPGVEYPATLVTTADHDDRVVPAHSFKYIATLQEKHTGKNPVLIRIDVNSGHGASNQKKSIETMADIYSFIFYNMGLKPSFTKK